MTYNNYSRSMNCVSTFPTAFSLVFIALILTLSIAAIDERIALYSHQPSLWYVNTYILVHSTPSVSHYTPLCYCRVDVITPINTTATPTPATPLPTTHTNTSLSLVYIPGNNLVSSRVTPWLALAIVRAICCSISWMLVMWISDFDRLLGEHTKISYPCAANWGYRFHAHTFFL